MNKFVFDANVPIGFHAINYLDKVLRNLRDLGNKVYMDQNNVGELSGDSGFQQKTLLRSSGIFDEVKSVDEDFKSFKARWDKDRIRLSPEDAHVAYVGITKRADFVISNDQTVVNKINKIREKYGIGYMKPMTSVGLITYLYSYGKIDFDEYLKVILKYFKYVELENIYNAITSQDRAWDLELTRKRFQVYKDPIFKALEERVNGKQTKVGMYG